MLDQMISSLAEEYAAFHTSPETPVLNKVNRDTAQNHAHAHMLSGHVQGKFLTFLTTILRPNFILEIGTFTGYSALCIAEGMTSDCKIHTIELREEDAETALNNFKVAKKDKSIILHRGNAKEIIPLLPYEWDMVFIDADKAGYIDYYELVLPKLSDKGFIIADNVLFHGQVLQDPIIGKNARAVDAFNKYVAKDVRVEQVMLTVRDGLLLIKKK
jgi:predicted O-methyltransferase YrrM